MDAEKTRFSIAVIAGVIVMILFALVTVNMLELVPLAGPFAGGLVAGLVAGKDYLTGGKAGAAAGMIGAIVVAVDFILHTGYLKAAVPVEVEVVGLLFLVVAIIFFPVLAFIGGIFGGLIRSWKANP